MFPTWHFAFSVARLDTSIALAVPRWPQMTIALNSFLKHLSLLESTLPSLDWSVGNFHAQVRRSSGRLLPMRRLCPKGLANSEEFAPHSLATVSYSNYSLSADMCAFSPSSPRRRTRTTFSSELHIVPFLHSFTWELRFSHSRFKSVQVLGEWWL